MQENPVFHKAHDFQFQPSECDMVRNASFLCFFSSNCTVCAWMYLFPYLSLTHTHTHWKIINLPFYACHFKEYDWYIWAERLSASEIREPSFEFSYSLEISLSRLFPAFEFFWDVNNSWSCPVSCCLVGARQSMNLLRSILIVLMLNVRCRFEASLSNPGLFSSSKCLCNFFQLNLSPHVKRNYNRL